MQETLQESPKALLARLEAEAWPEALSPPSSEGVYRLQTLINAPMPFMVAEPEEEGDRPFIIPWEIEEDGETRMLTLEEAAIQAVESVHDRMAEITDAMREAGLSTFIPFGLLYEKLTLANKVAMEKGVVGEEDGIQDVPLNGVVVVKFADKFFNAVDTVIEEMKAEPELGLEFNDSQRTRIHQLRVARYKRLNIIERDDNPAEGELETLELKESWRLLSEVEKNMEEELKDLPVWLLGSLGVSAHINADLIEALVEAGADNNYIDEFAVVQKMLDEIGRVVLHEFGDFPGEMIDDAINSLTLFFVSRWRQEVFGELDRFTNNQATQDELRSEADERAVSVGRFFMRIGNLPTAFVKTGEEIGEMYKNIRVQTLTQAQAA